MTAEVVRGPFPGRGAPAGAFAGAAGGLVFGTAMLWLGTLPDVAALAGSGSPWLGFLLHTTISVVVGAGFGLLAVHQRIRSSELLFWGLAYGVFWWFMGTLTLLPLLTGRPMTWSLEAAQAAVPSLLGHLYYGAVTAIGFALLQRDGHSVAGDHLRQRTLLRGLLAAVIVGGFLVLAFVWATVDVLATVARLVGATGNVAGWIVHLVIAQLIGVSYALLFRGRGYDLVSGVGWGLSYGFFWWVFGGLTLMPAVLGVPLWWNAPTIAADFASLIGHLAYGGFLGAVCAWLEHWENPWWVARSDIEAARATARREQVLGSAPALWILTVMIALTIPVIVTGA